jgi:hypothetical protein
VHADTPIESDNPEPLNLDADRTDATRSAAARLKVIQQALQESEARSRSLFEANPHPMSLFKHRRNIRTSRKGESTRADSCIALAEIFPVRAPNVAYCLDTHLIRP